MKGPKYGVNSIVWGENIRSIELMLGDRYDCDIKPSNLFYTDGGERVVIGDCGISGYWDKLDMGKVKHAEELLARRVKGQDEAIRKAAAVLSRACLGISGIQGGSSSRPKGVLFLAGPTGTGKTELAKTIAEFIFGDQGY